jgi:hypothetical protein
MMLFPSFFAPLVGVLNEKVGQAGAKDAHPASQLLLKL